MIGGLGLGFTLRSALAGLGPNAQVQVVELLPKVVSGIVSIYILSMVLYSRILA